MSFILIDRGNEIGNTFLFNERGEKEGRKTCKGPVLSKSICRASFTALSAKCYPFLYWLDSVSQKGIHIITSILKIAYAPGIR